MYRWVDEVKGVELDDGSVLGRRVGDLSDDGDAVSDLGRGGS